MIIQFQFLDQCRIINLLLLANLWCFSPAEGLEGHFRLVLDGSDHVTVKAAVKDVIPIKEMAGLELVGQFLPGFQIAVKPNSTSTAWVNVEELVKSQDVDVYRPDSTPMHEQFLGMLTEARLSIPHLGKLLI
jgi:hypothetical protein